MTSGTVFGSLVEDVGIVRDQGERKPNQQSTINNQQCQFISTVLEQVL